MSELERKPTKSTTKKTKVYLESRYRKLERGLPQTKFYCPDCKGDRRRSRGCERCGGYGKLTKDSVQELIARKAVPLFKAKQGKFHGAGREDLDVLMLGRGRPFVFEVVDSRRPDADPADLDRMIRESCEGRIELEPFRRVDRARVPYWKEAKFDKVYLAEVHTAAPPDPEFAASLRGRTIEIVQRTPSRVAHRRADLERERSVTIQSVGDLNGALFPIEIRCTHGTYVKEWISGDDGRTSPSLSSLLGVPTTCTALDVLEIVTDED